MAATAAEAVFGGVGIGFPIGGARVSQAFGAETALIDPANGATMWSGRASSSTAQDVTGQITELAQTTDWAHFKGQDSCNKSL